MKQRSKLNHTMNIQKAIDKLSNFPGQYLWTTEVDGIWYAAINDQIEETFNLAKERVERSGHVNPKNQEIILPTEECIEILKEQL